MFDAARTALARRRALKLVRQRVPRRWAEDPGARRVLVVLPSHEVEAKAAWKFVEQLGIPPKQVIPVVLAEGVSYAPAAHIGRIHRVGPKDVGWLGLTKTNVALTIWEAAPDVALCLAPNYDLAAAALAGASPAAFRIGFFEEDAEPFFDLMVVSTGSYASALKALGEALGRIEPSVLDVPAKVFGEAPRTRPQGR